MNAQDIRIKVMKEVSYREVFSKTDRILQLVSDQVSNQVSDRLASEVWNRVRRRVYNPVRIRNQIGEHVRISLKRLELLEQGKIFGRLSNFLWNELRYRAVNRIYNQVMARVREHVRRNLKERR